MLSNAPAKSYEALGMLEFVALDTLDSKLEMISTS